MSIDATKHPRQTTGSPTARRLNMWAAGLIIAICVLHIAVFIPHPYWPQWLDGELRNGNSSMESVAVFWALPGGFAVILALFGAVIFGMARKGEPVPRYLGWGFGLWLIMCIALIGVSGFVMGLIPAALLIVAGFMRSNRRMATTPEPSE